MAACETLKKENRRLKRLLSDQTATEWGRYGPCPEGPRAEMDLGLSGCSFRFDRGSMEQAGISPQHLTLCL